ncbi:hypothetical protein T439DRAFT_330214 [Meredithblackwellia eburnea MCA 4105]
MLAYLLLALYLPFSLADPSTFDTSEYYRITNPDAPGYALDVVGSYNIEPRAIRLYTLGSTTGSDYSGQYWQLTYLTSGPKYRFSTLYASKDYSLDILNDNGTSSVNARLYNTGTYSGQYWTISSWGDGTYGLYNDFQGPNVFLALSEGSSIPQMFPSSHTFGRRWSFTPIIATTAYSTTPLVQTGSATQVVSRASSGTTYGPSSTPFASSTLRPSSVSSFSLVSSTGLPAPTFTAGPKKTNTAAIAGGVVGGIGGLAIIGAGIFLFMRMKTQRDRAEDELKRREAGGVPGQEEPKHDPSAGYQGYPELPSYQAQPYR